MQSDTLLSSGTRKAVWLWSVTQSLNTVAVNTTQNHLEGDILPQNSDTFLSETSEMRRQDFSLAATLEWVILSSDVKGYRKVHIKEYQFLFSRKSKENSLLLWATETLISEARREVK